MEYKKYQTMGENWPRWKGTRITFLEEASWAISSLLKEACIFVNSIKVRDLPREICSKFWSKFLQ